MEIVTGECFFKRKSSRMFPVFENTLEKILQKKDYYRNFTSPDTRGCSAEVTRNVCRFKATRSVGFKTLKMVHRKKKKRKVYETGRVDSSSCWPEEKFGIKLQK